MPKLIVINSSNYVANSTNVFSYTLPQSVKLTNKSKIAVSSLSVYNSTFNITAARGNNTITFTWPSATPVTKTYNIPDGYYSSSDLNYFLQSKMYADNFYVTSNSGTNVVYFYEIVQNAVAYAIQLNSYYLPTSANAITLGYSQPSGATWSYPAANACPQLQFNTAFGALLGFSAQTYPATAVSTNQSKVSEITPNISPVDSYILTCNMVNSKYSIPSNYFFSIPLTGALGSLITYNSSSLVYNDVAPNVYSNIIISFFDQLFNRLQMNDREIVLTIAIDDSQEAP
jgi:hypothetical protein